MENEIEKEIDIKNALVPCPVAIRRNPPLPKVNRLTCMADVVRVDTFFIPDTQELQRTVTLENILNYQHYIKTPFIFSVPCKTTDWEKYGFSYVYDKEILILNKSLIPEDMLKKAINGENIRIADSKFVLYVLKSDELLTLSQFVNSVICRKYGVFVIRSAVYYEKLQKEVQTQGGEIFLIKENQKIKGCFIWIGKTQEVWEAVFEKKQDMERYFHSESEKKPTAMARIVNLEEMLKHTSSNGKVTIAIRIEDPVILENTGLFIWYLDENGSRMERIDETKNNCELKPELTVSIGELTEFLFSYKKLKPGLKFDSIYLSGPVWMNEKV